jgi:ABC-2 type transport system ATP-binding protein
MEQTPILSVQNIVKTYPGPVHALLGINLDIYAGEVLSLLGVNGAGKTTLSSILATLHPATSGDVLYNGVSIYKNLVSYRGDLGYCPQHANLDGFLTVRENLIFAGRYFLMPYDEIVQRADLLMEQFGLIRYANATVQSLSGGYQQRLSIARALMHKPRVVILDEPTVGLDPHIRRQLWDIIRKLKEGGITVIITTHYLDEAEALSDRACILHRGKILLTDTISALKKTNDQKHFEDIFIDLTQGPDKGGKG